MGMRSNAGRTSAASMLVMAGGKLAGEEFMTLPQSRRIPVRPLS